MNEDEADAIVRELAASLVREGRVAALLESRGYLVLLPLLQVPYSMLGARVAKHFSHAGIPWSTARDVSFLDLVVFALRGYTGSPYWAEKALCWLEQGLPMNEAVVDALRDCPLPASEQQARHRVARLLAAAGTNVRARE